jgi:hypothetical protein
MPILYEALTGQPAFTKELMFNQIAFMVNVKYELPGIPEFVLPSAREGGRTRSSAILR